MNCGTGFQPVSVSLMGWKPMPQTMSKTEDIEARLAAYIDGELDAAGRAEIEKHLAAHPKHHALIEELMGHKDLLKALPKQAAPGDLAEAFTAQLERAVLLGDVDAQAQRPPMRIGFFGQFRAVAAVLVLTVGLAALIYHLLPGPQMGVSPLAVLREAPPVPGVVMDEMELASARRSELEESVTTEARAREAVPVPMPDPVSIVSVPAAAAMPTTQPALSPAPVAVAMSDAAGPDLSRGIVTPLMERDDRSLGLTITNGGWGQDSVFRQMVDEQLKLATPTPSPSAMVVLRTEDMDLANLEVIRYLDTNNIRWEAQVQPMPAPLRLADSQIGAASRLQNQSVEMKSPAPQVAVGGSGGGAGAGGGGRGGRGPAFEADASGQRTRNETFMNQSVGVAGGDNVLRADPDALQQIATQRIVAKQMPRRQAQQVVSDLNQLQTRLALAKEADPADARSNTIVLAPGSNFIPSQDLNRIDSTGRQELESQDRVNARTGDTDPFASLSLTPPLRLVPTDPIAFFQLYREPISLELPTTRPATLGPTIGSMTVQPASADLVDIVIVLEPEPATPPAATQPTAP